MNTKMRLSKKSFCFQHTDSKPSVRLPYLSPKLRLLGNLEEITLMPGGSVDAEGGSGKPHKF